MCSYRRPTKGNLKPKRIRRVFPKKKFYIDGSPTCFDVVAGRGGGSNNHQGNILYWQKILANREDYTKCENNAAKTALAQEIVDSINASGCFLQKEKGSKEWFVLPNNIALCKVKQALRDEYVPIFARTRSISSQDLQDRLVFEGRPFFPIDDETDHFESVDSWEILEPCLLP